MKKLLLFIGVVLMTTTLSAQKKNAKVSFEVDGICGMCKKRIEKAALNTKGVKFASWDVKTHQLSLIIDERKITVKKIHENIAAVGHSTREVETTPEVYNKLDPCCLYNDEQVIKDHQN